MSHSFSPRAGLFLLSILAAGGCAVATDAEHDAAPPGRAAAYRPPTASNVAEPPPRPGFDWRALVPVPALAAWTRDGDLVVVDGTTGALVQGLPSRHLAGERDLAFDPTARRLWVAESDGEGAAGEVASFPVSFVSAISKEPPGVGSRAAEGALAADARLLATPAGVAVFEDRAGGAWRLLPGAGASIAAPRPMSAWATAAPSGFALHALAYGPGAGEIDAVRAHAVAGALAAAEVEAFGVDAGGVLPSAREVAAPRRGGALLLDVQGSFLTVRGASGASVTSPARVPLSAAGLRLEAAVAMEGGQVVIALVSGVSKLVAVTVTEELQIGSMAELPLPGVPTPSTRLFSHDLVVQGGVRVAAATSAGVFSAQIWHDTVGVHLGLDPRFAGADLRGPLAALDPRAK
jgi:hypothetical protein